MAASSPNYDKLKRQKIDEPGDINAGYICANCGTTARLENMYHGIQLMSDSYFNYLLSTINDTTADQHHQVMGKVVITVPVDCEKCKEEMDVNVAVMAKALWEESEESEPRLSHFQDITVVDVLHPFAVLDTSLVTCFHDSNTYDRIPDLKRFHGTEIAFRSDIISDVAKQRTLVIAGKAELENGYSYIAFDKVGETLLRPVFRSGPGKCSWSSSQNMGIGETYRITVFRHPNKNGQLPAPTLYPHRNDDILVDNKVNYIPAVKPVDLYELLNTHAKSSVKKLFAPAHIYNQQYIWVNRNCPSIGILACKDFNVLLYKDEKTPTKQVKIYLEETWSFPYTGVEEKPKERGRDVLLLLGLSRPWDNDGQFKPARCYIICLGIIVNKQLK